MISKILILLICLTAMPVVARTGGESGGGGDPHAIEFVALADSIGLFLEAGLFPEFVAPDFKTAVLEIRNSLDSKKNRPLIKFINSEVNCLGAPKIGCVDADNLVIINRPSWIKLSSQEKIELVSLEILQLMGLGNRYSIAQSIGEYTKEILKRKSNIAASPACMSVAIERSLSKARATYPKYLALVPIKSEYAYYSEIDSKNIYKVHIQVTTEDDYIEDRYYEFGFLQKNCIN